MASDIAVSGNSKPFWNYIKSKCNGTNTLVSLKVGDKELIENDSIASSFNSCWAICPKTGDQLTLSHFIRKVLNT